MFEEGGGGGGGGEEGKSIAEGRKRLNRSTRRTPSPPS